MVLLLLRIVFEEPNMTNEHLPLPDLNEHSRIKRMAHYASSDGTIWPTEDEAVKHERELVFDLRLRWLADIHGFDPQTITNFFDCATRDIYESLKVLYGDTE